MKCETIRDLVPLYIDGMVSEETKKEVEKHLKTCKECRICYQEMTGEIHHASAITDEEIQDVKIIKKIKNKNRRKTAGIFAGAILVVGIMGTFLLSQMTSRVKYDDVQLTCGVRGNTAYYTIESKPGYELHFTGSSGGKKSHLKVLSMKKIGDSQPDTMGWEDEVGTEENPCIWTIEFQDKTVVIENGKLVQEKENQ